MIKDFFGFQVCCMLLVYFICFDPRYLHEPVNVVMADPLSTPLHIVPEWYFLPYYGILKSINNRAWGILFFLFVLAGFALLPFFDRSPVQSSIMFDHQSHVLSYVCCMFVLAHIGGLTEEYDQYVWLKDNIIENDFFGVLPIASLLAYLILFPTVLMPGTGNY